MDQDNTELNFEEAITKLEHIVEEIEDDHIKLEEALLKYQEGIKLVQFCQAKLTEVEQEIKILDTQTEALKDFDS
jgi:exodeoxyribonuclease VII small subunit